MQSLQRALTANARPAKIDYRDEKYYQLRRRRLRFSGIRSEWARKRAFVYSNNSAVSGDAIE